MELGYSFNQLQNFDGILNEENIIVSLIVNIVPFWKENKDMWFSHEEISYFPTISTQYDNCKNINMALLLQYDQIFRHPCKLIKSDDKPFAFAFATKLALKMILDGQYDEMDDCEKVFTLLAIRHNNELKLKNFALKTAYEEFNSELDNDKALWLRFINASILDIDKLKTTIGYTPETLVSQNFDNSRDVSLDMLRERFNHILQKQREFDIYDRIDIKNIEKILENNVSEIMRKNDSDKFAISISGGVDSMVLSYICSKVCKKMNKQPILLHIMYNNRTCCEDEVELLKYWSEFIGAALYVRRIDEIQRDRSARFRTMYEDVTRRIRFSFYKWASCPILLGHNRDDTFENMFSNLAKGIHFDNLVGMNDIGIEDGVYILRPFLSINKKDIVNYADTLNIPHLYDSTPVWSRRGKTRDSLIPAINNFDPNILKGLEQFAQYTKFLYTQWEEQFERWNDFNVYNEDNNLTIKRDKYFNTNFHNISFWIRIWFENEMPTRPSNKSLKNLITNISNNKSKRCDMNKKYKCIISNDFINFIKV